MKDISLKVRDNVEQFLSDTMDARITSERCRDYYDHKQWTAEETAKLLKRRQAPIVVNRIKPKVEGLIGLYNIRNSDPKAYARTQAHEESSHVVTDALRYVADNNDFKNTRLDVAEDFFVEGYGGGIVDVKQKKNGEIEIRIEQIPWDRIYFDPHSRKKDYSDARWMGMYIWMYEDEAEEKFGSEKIQACKGQPFHTDETFEDRPRWVDSRNHRLRIALHFEIHKAVWHMSVSCGDVDIVKPQVSPFLDDDGEPCNPIELVSANIDRDNNRYGEVLGMLDQQDEINHRRSKFLHFLNSRQTFGRKGQTEDVAALKRELSKPDGHVEFNGEEFGKDFGILPETSAENGQYVLYQDAKAELDSISFNSESASEAQKNNLSGVAIGRIQQSESMELNRQYALLAGWEKRIYRQIWGRVKQFWNEEKWIRVTDDQDNLKWVGFNTEITVQEALEEKINDEAEMLHVRRMAAEMYTQMIQAQDPRLQDIMEVRNSVPEIDVDIILDQSFDSINIQEEQFQLLAQFGQGQDIDIIELIELSQLRGKDALIEKIEKRRAQAAQAAGGDVQLDQADKQAKIENTQADTVNKFMESKQKQIENELLVNQPDRVTSVAV